MSIRREDYAGLHRYDFHASAVTVDAEIHQEDGVPAPSRYTGPTVALPYVGGRKSATTKCHPKRAAHCVCHAHASAVVEGRIDPVASTAHVSTFSSMSGVVARNGDVEFTARTVEAFGASRRRLAPDSPNEFELGLKIEGVAIQGPNGRVEIEPVVDRELCRIPTLAALESRYAEPKFQKAYSKRFLAGSQPTPGVPKDAGWVCGSVVSHLLVTENGSTRKKAGHVFDYPGLGRVSFGDVMIREDHRKLTGATIRLGSKRKGNIILASIDHNSNSPSDPGGGN